MADASPSSAPPVPAAGGSMPVDLRPLSTSELIDRGFTLYRSNFAGCLLIALLCQTAPLIISQAMLASVKLLPNVGDLMERANTDFLKTGTLLAIWLIGQVVTFGFEVVLTIYLADAYLGRVPSVKAGLKRLKSCLGASLWTCLLNILLVGFTVIFPVVAMGAVYVYMLIYPPQEFLGILLFFSVACLLIVASLVPMLIVFMRVMLTVPAVALEGLSGWKAVKRSSQLVRFDPGLGFLYWGEMRLSFLLLPLLVIELLVLPLTAAPLGLNQINEVLRHGAIGQVAAPPESAIILSQILILFSSSLLLPLYLIATTLFYYDVRIRREGFDLEFLAGQLGTAK